MFSDVLLTVDFDRTLTAPDSSIPKRNLEAIEYFMAHGGSFTVNTGRSIPMCQKNILGKIPVNAPLLLYNGSAIYDQSTGDFSQCRIIDLDPDAVIADVQSQFPQLRLEIQGRDAHYLAVKDGGWEALCQNNGCPWDYCQPSKVPGPFIKFSVYGQFRENTVSSMFDGEEWEFELFRQVTAYIAEKYGHKLELFRAAPRILDMHAKGTSKGNSARALQERLGKKILVCVGDADNDLSMLQAADHAFCPADAVIADRFPNVCPCGEGAIADVIYEKIPQILKISLDK